jgi:hypothetical protein
MAWLRLGDLEHMRLSNRNEYLELILQGCESHYWPSFVMPVGIANAPL